MLSAFMLNVVMLSVMAPERLDKGENVCKAKRSSLFSYYTPKKFLSYWFLCGKIKLPGVNFITFFSLLLTIWTITLECWFLARIFSLV
jgi:hypothetical protein